MKTCTAPGLEAETVKKDFSRTNERQNEASPTVAKKRKGMSLKRTGLMQSSLRLRDEILLR